MNRDVCDKKFLNKYLNSTFEKIKIIEIIPFINSANLNKRSQRYVKIKCDCGVEKIVLFGPIKQGRRKSCGCTLAISRKRVKETSLSFVGKEINRIKVLSISRVYKKHSQFKCLCFCGKEFDTRTTKLIKGLIISCGCTRRKWGTQVLTPRAKYLQYKFSAAKRKISFNIDENLFEKLIQINCIYCSGRNKGSHNGLDRIDNNIGYEVNNIVPCCAICNRAKLEETIEVFLEWRNQFSNTILTKECIIKQMNIILKNGSIN
jgi:hypothetical protein